MRSTLYELYVRARWVQEEFAANKYCVLYNGMDARSVRPNGGMRINVCADFLFVLNKSLFSPVLRLVLDVGCPHLMT